MLITCRRYCRSLLITHVASGRRRRIPAPSGDFFDEGGGALSPGGALVAIPTLVRKRDKYRRLAIVHLRSGTVRLIRHSRVLHGYVYITWSSSGRRVYLSGGEQRRRIVAYRLGARRAHPLRVHLGRFYGMAAG